MRANIKYMTSKIPILFVHGCVALKVGEGDRKQVLQRSRVCFCVPDCSTLGMQMVSNFDLADLLSGKLVDRNWEQQFMELLAKLEHLLFV